jgi:hypothetical protein
VSVSERDRCEAGRVTAATWPPLRGSDMGQTCCRRSSCPCRGDMHHLSQAASSGLSPYPWINYSACNRQYAVEVAGVCGVALAQCCVMGVSGVCVDKEQSCEDVGRARASTRATLRQQFRAASPPDGHQQSYRRNDRIATMNVKVERSPSDYKLLRKFPWHQLSARVASGECGAATIQPRLGALGPQTDTFTHFNVRIRQPLSQIPRPNTSQSLHAPNSYNIARPIAPITHRIVLVNHARLPALSLTPRSTRSEPTPNTSR